jgi:SulP family sulfate permease
LITSFLLTVFVDITVAVLLGMILASFLFMKRMSEYSKTVSLTKLFQEPLSEFPEHYDPDAIIHKNILPQVEVYELQGPFFFAVTDMLKDILGNLEKSPKVFILRMRHVPLIDASGMQALKDFYHKCVRSKTVLLLSGIQGQTERDLRKLGLSRLIGEDHIFSHIDAALTKAEEIVNLDALQ